MKALRENKGLTQKQVAALLGVTDSYISKVETLAEIPSVEKIVLFAELYAVTTDEILRRVGIHVKKKCIAIYSKVENKLVALITGEEIDLHDDYTADIEFIFSRAKGVSR